MVFTTPRAAPFASMIWMSVKGSERRREPMLADKAPEPDSSMFGARDPELFKGSLR